MSVSDPGEKIEWGADSEPRKNERVPSSVNSSEDARHCSVLYIYVSTLWSGLCPPMHMCTVYKLSCICKTKLFQLAVAWPGHITIWLLFYPDSYWLSQAGKQWT
jgi:hypothetical protein